MEKAVDVLVIGAGISGLAFASTYLGVHPTADLVVFEKEDVLGGTWSRRRLYDHFYTQASVGFVEFSDKPMPVPPEEDQYCGLFRSKHTTAYLEDYATTQTFDGRSLRERIRFSTSVTGVRRQGDAWVVEWEDALAERRRGTVLARRLVVASGRTSVPHVPAIEGSHAFPGPIVHSRDFGSCGVLANPGVDRITVLGGGKSGADMVYACVKAGKDVSWIVRPSRTGPCTFVGAKGKGPFKNAFELSMTRVAEALQPSYFASSNWWTYFLQQTRLGMALSRAIFAAIQKEAVADADYANRPARGGFEKLVPHTPILWQNSAAGIVNHADFYEVIAGSVDIRYEDVKEIRANEIHFESGKSVQADALLLGTGWREEAEYLSPSLRAELGLPYPSSAESTFTDETAAGAKDWTRREHRADRDIIARFPLLADPPAHFRAPRTLTPYRLYNLTVPVDDPTRSFAVIGMIETTNYFLTGEVQSHWVTAYFDGKVTLPPVEARVDDVAHFVAWNRRRYLSLGDGGDIVVFDTVGFVDRLLAQLGLASHLKSGFAHLFAPNRASDYAGFREEFRRIYRQG